MPSLRELQIDMLAAILDGASLPAETWRQPGRKDARARLAVHTENAHANFLSSLESSYPVVCRLVGAAYFRQTVRRFQQVWPSRCGDLLPAGAGFATFLRDSSDDEFAYLAEVARLEWLVQESLLSGDAPALDLGRLAARPPKEYDALRFQLHPACRLFHSRFPSVAIWQANVDLTRLPERIDLDASPCATALARTGGQLTFHALSDGELRFLTALAEGLPFAEAIESGSADRNFNPTSALARFVRSEIIVDFT